MICKSLRRLAAPGVLNAASPNIIYATVSAEPTPERTADAAVDDATTIYSRSGIGARVGFGSCPAVVVVDLQHGFTDPASPVGDDLRAVVAATADLLEVARRRRLPIAFTVVGFHPSHRDGATWLRKMPGLGALIEGSHWCEIDEGVQPREDEPVWTKRASSAFFGTPLHTFLVVAGVDTLIVTGCVTSGCVRATVVDAVSFGYRVIVPAECVGDRAEGPHAWNLFDIDSKYADVEPLERVVALIEPAATVAG
jgi:maleamate amidohydrolase